MPAWRCSASFGSGHRRGGAGGRRLAAAHAYQDDVFGQLTAGRSVEDATRFATYLRRLADQ